MQYETATGAPPDPWELLGIDAGEFVGQYVATKSTNRTAVKKSLSSVEEFTGLAVTVDFNGGRENRFARILQHRNGELTVAR
jgi:hypothetical protein